MSANVSDHNIKYAASADIAIACRVDDTLHPDDKLTGIGNKVFTALIFMHFYACKGYLLSQSILSRAFRVLYVLVEAFEK